MQPALGSARAVGAGGGARGAASAGEVGRSSGGYDPATGRRRIRQLGTFETRRAAIAYQKGLVAGRIGTETETVGDYLEWVWLPAKEGRVEVSTLDQYNWAVRHHIKPLIGAVRPRPQRRTAEAKRNSVARIINWTPSGSRSVSAASRSVPFQPMASNQRRARQGAISPRRRPSMIESARASADVWSTHRSR